MENKNKWYLVGMVLISIIIANVHVAVWPFYFVLFLPYIAEYMICILIDSNVFINLSSDLEVLKLKVKINILNRKLKNKKANNEEIENKINEFKKILDTKIIERKEKLDKTVEKRNIRRENPYKIKLKRNDAVVWLMLILVICAFTGLLTPLGDTPYTYLIKTMQGNTTKNISEHLPLTLYNDKLTMVVFTMYLALLIFTKVKIKLRDLFMLGGMVFLCFMSRRQISLFTLICNFIFAKLLVDLINRYDIEGTNLVKEFLTTIVGKVLTICFILILSIAIYKPKVNNQYIDSSSYPVEASKWIKENLNIEEIKIFNEYNYGSYLLYEGIPVFIDSRADLYAPEFNVKTLENGIKEKRDIFSDYINTTALTVYYEDIFDKYEITHVILTKKSKLNLLISKDENYKEIYKDSNFYIYERSK